MLNDRSANLPPLRQMDVSLSDRTGLNLARVGLLGLLVGAHMTAPAADLMLPAAGIGVWPGAVVSEADGLRFVCGTGAVHPDSVRDPTGAYHPVERMHLDLTHRPTRLEVMARLGARVGADVSEGVLWFRMFARRTWMNDGNGGTPGTWAPEEDGDASILPALADLDPADDTRLPDGARRVDVQALAIVAAHVFGPVSSHPG